MLINILIEFIPKNTFYICYKLQINEISNLVSFDFVVQSVFEVWFDWLLTLNTKQHSREFCPRPNVSGFSTFSNGHHHFHWDHHHHHHHHHHGDNDNFVGKRCGVRLTVLFCLRKLSATLLSFLFFVSSTIYFIFCSL